MTALTTLARPYTICDGQITLRMMPYRTLAVDVAIETLAPDGGALDVGRTMFVLCDTLTVDAQFNLAEDAPAALRAFEMYWRERPADIHARWELFAQVMDTSVLNAWWAAYEATRDNAGMLTSDPEV